MADILVIADDRIALAALDGDRDDLVLELARLLRGAGLLLAGGGELVLLLAGDLELGGHVFGGGSHVVAVEGVPQPVLDHGVDHAEVAHLDALAQISGVGGLAHALLAAGDDDLALAAADLLRCERDRAKAGAADLVDEEGGRAIGDARRARGLATGILALRGGQHLTEDDFVDIGRVELGPLERGFDRVRAENMRRHVAERAVETADRRAHGGNDDHLFHVMTSLDAGR